jgi:putative ATPase
MKELGYGRDYAYDHDEADAFSGRDYFPEGMARRRFYRPTDRGAEAALAERLARWDALRAQKTGRGGDGGA